MNEIPLNKKKQIFFTPQLQMNEPPSNLNNPLPPNQSNPVGGIVPEPAPKRTYKKRAKVEAAPVEEPSQTAKAPKKKSATTFKQIDTTGVLSKRTMDQAAMNLLGIEPPPERTAERISKEEQLNNLILSNPDIYEHIKIPEVIDLIPTMPDNHLDALINLMNVEISKTLDLSYAITALTAIANITPGVDRDELLLDLIGDESFVQLTRVMIGVITSKFGVGVKWTLGLGVKIIKNSNHVSNFLSFFKQPEIDDEESQNGETRGD